MPPPRWLCALDPCDQAAMSMPGVVVCPDGWRCTDHLGSPGPGLGACFGGAGRFGQSCGDAPTDRADRCETGTFCAARECAVADAIRKLPGDAAHPLPDADGVCAFPIHEGEVCDSDLADRHSPDPAVRLAANSLCAPCEAGTYCVSNLISGFNGPANERRCIRRCEASDGSPDPDLCSCNRASCTDRGVVINPVTGEVDGRYFCDACTEDNVRPCAQSNGSLLLACCDGNASCEAVTDLNGDPNHLCCRPPGTVCDLSARAAGHDTCCYGSACGDTGICETCAGAGQSPLGGECCPGLEPIPESASGGNSARLICQRCNGVEGGSYACSKDRFLVTHADARVENVPIPTTDHPWRSTVGSVGGALNTAFGASANVDYSVDDRYRAFLLQGYDHGATHLDLSTTAGGDTFLALPLHSSLPRQREGLRTDYHYARIYDSGDCSLTLPWQDLANTFTVAVNQQLALTAASLSLVRWVETDSLTLSPSLDSEATYPASFPLGPLTEHDKIHVDARFRVGTGSVFGFHCTHDNAHVQVGLDGEIVLYDGFLETSASLAQLQLLRQVGCTVRPENPRLYDCMLPSVSTAADGTSIVTLYPAVYGRHAPITPSVPPSDIRLRLIDAQMAQVSCTIVRGSFSCSVPDHAGALRTPEDMIRWQHDPAYADSTTYRGEGCFYYDSAYPPATPPVPDTLMSPEERARREAAFWQQRAQEQFCRRHWPLFFHRATGARPVDYPPDAKDLGLDIDLRHVSVNVTHCSGYDLGFRDYVATHNVRGPLLTALSNIQIPDIFANILGARADLDAGVDPTTLPRCTSQADCRANPSFGGYRYGCVDTGTVGWRCAQIRYEPRRINARPDGMELVFADGRDDPQRPLLNGRSLSVGAGPNNALCGPNRPHIQQPPRPGMRLRVQHMRAAIASRLYRGRICAYSDAACRDICPAIGVRCAQAPLLGYSVAPPLCVNGSCPGITP